MIATRKDVIQTETEEARTVSEAVHERWKHVHVNWTAAILGALATFGVLVLFGLAATALGAHSATPENRLVDIRRIGIWTIAISVCGAFFASAIGGWVSGKIAGILHSEPAMIHGAASWLATVPLVLFLAAPAAGHIFGGWYGGLGPVNNAAPYTRPQLAANATAEEQTTYRTELTKYDQQVRQWNEDTPRVIQNTALTAVTALLIGLIGSVVGGWMSAGEPMTLMHYRTRKPIYHLVP